MPNVTTACTIPTWRQDLAPSHGKGTDLPVFSSQLRSTLAESVVQAALHSLPFVTFFYTRGLTSLKSFQYGVLTYTHCYTHTMSKLPLTNLTAMRDCNPTHNDSKSASRYPIHDFRSRMNSLDPLQYGRTAMRFIYPALPLDTPHLTKRTKTNAGGRLKPRENLLHGSFLNIQGETLVHAGSAAARASSMHAYRQRGAITACLQSPTNTSQLCQPLIF